MTELGLTSFMLAAARAHETHRGDALFRDPLAASLAGRRGFALWASLQRARGTAGAGVDPYLTVRTRFLDELALDAARGAGVAQIVLLGAGMDARAFRLRWPAGVRLFEIDRAAVLEAKALVLERLGAHPLCERRVVAADLAADWAAPLIEAGFETARPAVFLIEGVLVYLEPASVDGLLRRLGTIAGPGSWLGADVADARFLADPRVRPVRRWLADQGWAWRFGVSDPEEWLACAGWDAAVVVPGEPSAHYGRWPVEAAARPHADGSVCYLIGARRAGERATVARGGHGPPAHGIGNPGPSDLQRGEEPWRTRRQS